MLRCARLAVETDDRRIASWNHDAACPWLPDRAILRLSRRIAYSQTLPLARISRELSMTQTKAPAIAGRGLVASRALI
jgi:hypothetical protein